MEIFSTGRNWKRLNSTKGGVIETQEMAEFEIIWTVRLFQNIYQRLSILFHGFGVISKITVAPRGFPKMVSFSSFGRCTGC